MKISLSIAADMITKLSGHKINKDALRNQIVRGKWTYPVDRADASVWGQSKNSAFMVEKSDVVKFAKEFKGLKVGKPKKLLRK